jgi:hypothetical protein
MKTVLISSGLVGLSGGLIRYVHGESDPILVGIVAGAISLAVLMLVVGFARWLDS